jgi:hypothetical protein
MPLNLDIALKISVPIVTLILGILLNRWFEDRPRLIKYISNTFAINSPMPNGQMLSVHTHTVVVRNAGRKTAENVRLGHAFLPAFQVFPSINYSVVLLPDGSKEILIPTMVPKEQIIINYLYFPPQLWSQINTYTKSDQGFAKDVNIILTRQLSGPVRVFGLSLLMLGLVSFVYIIVVILKAIL